jgi:hypothetical protein
MHRACNLAAARPVQYNENTRFREEKLRKFALILFAAIVMSVSALAADTTVKGHLVDLACATEEGNKPGFAAKHTKDCLLMDECVKSGYGVMTPDKKVIRFDKVGNAEASKFISTLKKEKDIKVAVTGNVNGNSMSVSKIELQ